MKNLKIYYMGELVEDTNVFNEIAKAIVGLVILAAVILVLAVY